MKNLSIVFLFVFCTNSLYSQNTMNNIVFDENSDQEILLGYCNIDGLKNSTVTDWFIPEYEEFSLDPETLELINPELMQELEFYLVMGTWCDDSQREVPRIIKITEHLNLQPDQLVIIAVDKNKEAGTISLSDMNIEFVPTLIIYLNGAEIGRIIESPTESLEKDLLNIISSQ